MPFEYGHVAMPEVGSITKWVADAKAGDGEAAHGLWQRYYNRLIGLARAKLGAAPRRAMDEEDVVQNAFNSFFRGAEQGRFPRLDDRDDLWQVLVMLTARKAINQFHRETAEKRGRGLIKTEADRVGTDSVGGMNAIDQVVGSVPTPEFAAQVVEQLESLFEELDDPALRLTARLKMEGYTNDEIARSLDCKTRTVERKLQLIRRLWSEDE